MDFRGCVVSDIFGMGFLTDGLVGHLSYIFLIVSSLMRRMMLLRLFLVASAVTGIAYDWIWLGNVVGVFWEGLLIAVNVVQIALLWHRDRRARFSDEERRMIARYFRGGTPGHRRALFDHGEWIDLEPGHGLTWQGEKPRWLTYLSDGRAHYTVNGVRLGEIGPGHFVGEMSMLGETTATADVAIDVPTRVWRIDRVKLDRLQDTNPDLFGLVAAAIALDLRAKMVASNTRALEVALGPA